MLTYNFIRQYFNILTLNRHFCLGYYTNILKVLSGRSKNLGTKKALGSYISANLKIAVSFYEQIIDRIS